MYRSYALTTLVTAGAILSAAAAFAQAGPRTVTEDSPVPVQALDQGSAQQYPGTNAPLPAPTDPQTGFAQGQFPQGGFPQGQFGPNAGFQPRPGPNQGLNQGFNQFRPPFGQNGPPGGPSQPGLSGGNRFFSMVPGATATLVAYCTDLMATAPGGDIKLAADPGTGDVAIANAHLTLAEAQKQGLISIRGHDPGIDGPRSEGMWLDFHLVNRSAYTINVRVDPGTVFTPEGQARPSLDPHILTLLAVEEKQGLSGSSAACMATWASRGSSLQDVAEQEFALPPAGTAASVQRLLDSAGIRKTFDEGDADYQGLYHQKLAALGAGARAMRLPLKLADGKSAEGTLTRNAAGDGVVEIEPAGKTGFALFYTAKIADQPGKRFTVTLLQPKTGRPVPAASPLGFHDPGPQ